MKLKQRVLILGAVTTLLFVSMICVTYHYTQTYVGGAIFSSADPEEVDKLSRMKVMLAEMDQARPRKRRLKKSMIAPNSSAYDSNRAVEVELNDTEYEDMIRRKDMFMRSVLRLV